MATADVQEIRATSYVGFDSITQQIEHKLLKRGFQFNVIVVGTSRPPFSLSCAFQNRLHCVEERSLIYRVLATRSNRFGKVDPHQHHICVTPHRLEGQA
jgi:septin family protein